MARLDADDSVESTSTRGASSWSSGDIEFFRHLNSAARMLLGEDVCRDLGG